MNEVWRDVSNFVDWLLGLSLKAEDIDIGRMSLRAVIVFTIAIMLIRFGDKRFMGKSTVLDAMLGIVFGSVVSRAISGNAPFFPSLAAAAVLVMMHFGMSAIAFRSPGFGEIVKGQKRPLIEQGEVNWGVMKSSHVTQHDIEEQIRLDGKEKSMEDVKTAFLERSGDISLVYKEDVE